MIGGVIANNYRVGDPLREGGFVHAATHERTGRRVVVELTPIPRDPSRRAEIIAAFERDARAAGAIESRHVAPVIDFGVDEGAGVLYVVTERLEGEDLATVLARTGALPFTVAARVGLQMLLGLAKAHAAGVVHGGIEPGNVLVARREGGEARVSLGAFGIAKARVDAVTEGAPGSSSAPVIEGLPRYISPEQASGAGAVDARSDLWSVGAVLYEALTGAPPHHEAATIGDLMLAICTTPARPIAEIAPSVPASSSEVVARALAIAPGDRFASAGAMHDALRAAFAGESSLRWEELVARGAASEAASSVVDRARGEPAAGVDEAAIEPTARAAPVHDPEAATLSVPALAPPSVQAITLASPDPHAALYSSDEDVSPVRMGAVIRERYRVDSVLARGGLGVILRADDLELDRPVAIKMLTRKASTDDAVRRRFKREARMAVRLKSEHVARVLDVGELPRGEQYIVLEYLEGEDLSRVLAREGRFSVEDAVDHALQACEALAEAHALGIVHRDVKLANLFATRRSDGSSCVKVIDFGIAKSSAAAPDSTALTKGMVIGTPRSMAPEQVKPTDDADARIDIWALGAVLFELLTNEPPFRGEDIAELFARILYHAPARVDVIRPDVPSGLADVVARCLAKSPDDRYPSMGALAQALAPYAPPRSIVSVERAGRLGPPAAVTTTAEARVTNAPARDVVDEHAVTTLRAAVATPPSAPPAPPERVPPRALRAALALLAVVAVIAYLGLRAKHPTGAQRQARLGAGCKADAECDGIPCIRGLCATRCAADAECGLPSRCIAGACTLPLKVGFVHFGIPEDEGWTQAHDRGRLFAQSKLPFLETDIITNAYKREEAERAVDDFVGRGFEVIVATSVSHRDAVVTKAKQYPDKTFIILASKPPLPEVTSVESRLEDAFYLAGITAARVSRTKRLGFVGPLVIPDAVRYANAITLGARSVDPSIVVEVRWLGFWFDDGPADAEGRHKEEHLAEALMSSGCDVILHSLDNARVTLAVDAAAAAGKRVFAVATNTAEQCDSAPSACIGFVSRHWGPFYTQAFTAIHERKWKRGAALTQGIHANPEQSLIQFTVRKKVVPRNVADEVAEARARLARPDERALTGPFCYVGEPRECQPAGVPVDDEGRRTMCRFIEGVVEREKAEDPRSADRPAVVPEACQKNQ